MTRYIIVKYPELFQEQKSILNNSIVGTHCANELEITCKIYEAKLDAEYDCKRLIEFNGGASYGVMELIEG